MKKISIILIILISCLGCKNYKHEYNFSQLKLLKATTELDLLKIENETYRLRILDYQDKINAQNIDNMALAKQIKACENSNKGDIILIENVENILYIYYEGGQVEKYPFAHNNSPIPLILFEK